MSGIIRSIINIFLTIVEFILMARLILRFFDANPRTPFVAWIYDYSSSLVAPFYNILPNWKIGLFVLDLTTLVALIVYAFLGGIILELFPRG